MGGKKNSNEALRLLYILDFRLHKLLEIVSHSIEKLVTLVGEKGIAKLLRLLYLSLPMEISSHH